MHKIIELLWFLGTVSPAALLILRTGAVRHKARRRETAWQNAERYILGCTAPGPSLAPEPSRSSVPEVGSHDEALAA
jgi:hypothetical protein